MNFETFSGSLKLGFEELGQPVSIYTEPPATFVGLSMKYFDGEWAVTITLGDSQAYIWSPAETRYAGPDVYDPHFFENCLAAIETIRERCNYAK